MSECEETRDFADKGRTVSAGCGGAAGDGLDKPPC